MASTAAAAAPTARGRVREALQASGMQLTAARGLENISVADILADAGVSRRTFYTQFANKHELVASVINPALRDGAQLLDDVARQPPAELLPGIAATYLRMWDQHGDALIAIAGLDKGIMPHVADGHRLFGKALQKVLEKANENGLLRSADATLSFRVISRTAVPLLKIFADAENGRTLYRDSMLALLQATDDR